MELERNFGKIAMCPISRLSSMATVVCFTSNEPFVDKMSLHGNRDFVVILNLDAWSVTPNAVLFSRKRCANQQTTSWNGRRRRCPKRFVNHRV